MKQCPQVPEEPYQILSIQAKTSYQAFFHVYSAISAWPRVRQKPWTDDYTGKSGSERLFTCINCVSDIGYELNKRPEPSIIQVRLKESDIFTCTFYISDMSNDSGKGLRTVDYTGKIGRKRLFTCTNSIFGMSWESSESPGMTIFNLWIIRLTLSGMRAIGGRDHL